MCVTGSTTCLPDGRVARADERDLHHPARPDVGILTPPRMRVTDAQPVSRRSGMKKRIRRIICTPCMEALIVHMEIAERRMRLPLRLSETCQRLVKHDPGSRYYLAPGNPLSSEFFERVRSENRESRSSGRPADSLPKRIHAFFSNLLVQSDFPVTPDVSHTGSPAIAFNNAATSS